MSDEQISLLERYLLESDKEKFFATLVKNSETYVSMRLLDQINRHGLDIPAEGLAELKTFLGDMKSEKTIIQFKHLLLEIENQKDPVKRKDLLHTLNTKFLSIQHHFSRPANIKQSEQLRTFGDAKKPSTFDASKFDFDSKVENYFNQSDHMQIRNFRPQFLHKIDAKRVLDKSNDAFEYILNTLQSYSHILDLVKLLKIYITDKRKHIKGAVINSNYFHKMTIAQLEDLKTGLPEVASDRNFISILFQKTFDMDLNCITDQDESDPVKYRSLLIKILTWLKDLPKQHTFMSFKSQVQREILQVDLENNSHNKDAFINYLENPNSILDCFDTAQRSKLSSYCSYDNFWHSIHNIKIGNWTDEKKLIEEYLQHFFKTMTNFGEFEKYFSPTYLSRQYYTAKLLNGENVDNITKIFNEAELTQLRESKKLKFVSWNKARFNVGDEVTLNVEVKNIQNFCVNIFEINAESYYRKNKTEINERINLTGLIPSKVIEHNLTTAPIKSQVLEFKSLFEPKRGVYVVEFIGGGLSSRALLRIGALSLIRQVLSKGLLFHMIDEQKNVCRSDKTDILIGDKVFRPEPGLNWGILIPCTDKDINESAILRHEGFAELQHLLIPREQISFDMGLLFNEENLVSGAQLSLLMMPKLFVMGQDVSLITLKKVKAEVTSTNDIGINNTSNFDDVKIENGKDVTLSYLVPPKTESITVKLSAKFYSSAQEKEVDVSSFRTVSINRFRDKQIYYNYYLSQSGKSYILHFLGKNGEPFSNQKATITFTPLYMNQNHSETFETDAKGIIQLGDLSTISNFSVNMLDAPCTDKINSNFQIVSNDKINTLPRSFDIVEGEEICFPYAGDTFKDDEYELVKVRKSNQASVTHDYSKNIKNEEGAIYLTGLGEGYYKFLYRASSVSITINVHRGKRWEASTEYLVKEKSVIRLLNQNLYLTYKNFRINNKKVSFQVRSNNLNNVQVHATAFIYFPSTLGSLTNGIKSLKVHQDAEVFNLNSNSNVFLSEKSLSDEIKYVLERKRKNTFMGNTLDKPSSLLKRHFVRETMQDQEQLKAERDYDEAKKRNAQDRSRLGGVSTRGASSTSFSVSNLNTFLGRDGWSQFNISPNADGLIEFELPADTCYGTLLIVIKDNKNSVVEVRPLDSAEHVFKSVTLAESKKANKVYLYDRLAHKMAKRDTCEIKDLAATELSLVEDVQTLFKMLKLISTDNRLDEWDFLAKWPSLSPEEQLKKYDKYLSHELNLFAYFKDHEFFELVVRPHIVSKSTKQVVDYFLLGDEAEMKKYLNPIHLNGLNALELSLVVLFFTKSDTQRTSAIAANVKAKVSTQYHDVKEFKRLFDSVLKAQITKDSAAGVIPVAPLQTANANFSNMAPMAQPMMMQQQAFMPNNFANLSNAASPFMQMRQRVQATRGTAGQFSNRGGRGGHAPQLYADRAENRSRNENLDLETDSIQTNYDYEAALNDDFCSSSYNNNPTAVGLPQAIERYRTLGVTNEYIEKQYYNNTNESILPNKFWAAYLTHITTNADQPFLSEHFIYTTSGLSEMLLVLALTDLPFEKGTHSSESTNNQLKLTAGSNCIVFTKEIQEKGDQKLDLEIMISQRFYDPFDRYIFSSDGQSRTLKNVEEFLVGKLYMSRVAITNSSDTQHEINVVTEIPQGSIPVVSLEYMKSTNMVLEHLSTQVVEFYFYFPSEGEFTCYPASINKDGCLVTTATGVDKLKVVKNRVATELKTISDILSLGSKDDILNFMEKENLHNTDIFNFADIYWLLEDPEFYKSVLELLRKRFIFDNTVWSFSLKHGDYETAKEYLNEYYFKNRSLYFKDGDDLIYVSSELAKIDKFDFKEYNPLVNPRVHDIGEYKHNILNRDFKASYHIFLKYLFQKTFLTAKDYTHFSTYLLLQDRIDDALAIYPLIKAEEINAEMKIQYDYLSAYLDLYKDYPKFTKARAICNEYLTYPVFTWRNRFIDLVNQISEFDGDTDLMKKETEETDTEKNNRQAKKEEYISSELQGKSIKVTSKNISNFSIKFYKIDLEIMFSQDPFLSVEKNDYSYVTPNHILEKSITASNEYTTDLVAIPEGLVTANLIIQISSGGLSENLTYFPSSMKVFIVKNFGQIKVSAEDTEKPLSNIYIKTFAKKSNGTVSFYKDGYTDLRGTFEYTSVSSSDLGDISEFSILVFSEKHGAQIKQVKPPSTVAKVEVNATKVVSTKMQLCQANQVSKASHKYAMF